MKTSVLAVRLDDNLKKKFKETCNINGQCMSKVIEQMIKKAILES